MRYLAIFVLFLSVSLFSTLKNDDSSQEAYFPIPIPQQDDSTFNAYEDFEGPYNHETGMDELLSLCFEAGSKFCRYLFRTNN